MADTAARASRAAASTAPVTVPVRGVDTMEAVGATTLIEEEIARTTIEEDTTEGAGMVMAMEAGMDMAMEAVMVMVMVAVMAMEAVGFILVGLTIKEVLRVVADSRDPRWGTINSL